MTLNSRGWLWKDLRATLAELAHQVDDKNFKCRAIAGFHMITNH
ncbi:hypothetical protein Pan153_06770 [Gimesia panareensis]|uniref:Uncharacterized protein n=1 Tax=Gimesia panareensis TaxID=2527978 RepID=A0A518FI89_9PLAN|nr:hypothetical protein Pan153_06770 [Gimesia panareensis]